MMHEPLFAPAALELTRRHVNSARPDAPVVPDVTERPTRAAATRARLAGSLRSVARWVEHRPAKVCQPS